MRRAADIHAQLSALLPQLSHAPGPTTATQSAVGSAACSTSKSAPLGGPAAPRGATVAGEGAELPCAAGSAFCDSGGGGGDKAGELDVDALRRQAADASDTTALRRALTTGLAMHGATLQLDGA